MTKELIATLRSAGADGDAMYCWTLCTKAANAIEALQARADNLEQQAKIHAQEARTPNTPPTCTWALIGDSDDGVWESSCGKLWSFIDGGPKENRVNYCHFCGKKVDVT